VLLGLIGLNITVFFGQIFLEAYQPGFVQQFLGLSDEGLRDAYSWQFVTALFIHNGPWHLLANMLVLYLVGRDVESIIGQRQFLLLYLAGGVGGELTHLFLMPSSAVLLGASGGVAAVVVAYATILPELELRLLFFSFLPFRLKAKHLAYGAYVISILGVILDRDGAVTHSAYLGGCIAGWLYAHLLGFGRPSIVQRTLRQHRTQVERYQAMSAKQFIAEEVDPVLDKIAREGIQSLTWAERRTLAVARDKITATPKRAV
jgi:membrane associated rhomboid family serine protease